MAIVFEATCRIEPNDIFVQGLPFVIFTRIELDRSQSFEISCISIGFCLEAVSLPVGRLCEVADIVTVLGTRSDCICLIGWRPSAVFPAFLDVLEFLQRLRLQQVLCVLDHEGDHVVPVTNVVEMFFAG